VSDVTIFRGGISIKPDLDRLNKTLDLKIGDLVTHQTIADTVGEKIGTSRYRTVVHAWRMDRLRNAGLVIESERGVGYRVLNSEQKLSSATNDIDHIARASRKATIKVELVEPAELSEHDKGRHSIIRRHTHAIADMARQARKELSSSAPKFITASPVRLAETQRPTQEMAPQAAE
jgi:biotin operon repressor